jgi:hypothetical protein
MGAEMNSLEKNHLCMDHQQQIRSWHHSLCKCICLFVLYPTDLSEDRGMVEAVEKEWGTLVD